MKYYIILIMFLFNILQASDNINIKMEGDLDDDIFIIKATPEYTKLVDVYQMHNPDNKFKYIDTYVKSKRIYGIVNIDLNFSIKRDEILLIMLANEREEFHSKKELVARTHYKSVPLFVNNNSLIPSMLPEKNDLPNYPKWFSENETVCHNLPIDNKERYKNYNYYKLWENAIVNTGIVFPKEGNFKIEWYNLNGKKVFEYNGYAKRNKAIRLSPSNSAIKIVSNNLMTESDGKSYINKNNNDKLVKENACNDIKIIFDNNEYYIDMPYPLPYINLFYAIVK